MEKYMSTRNIIIGVVVLALVVSAAFFLSGGDLSGTAGDDDDKVSDQGTGNCGQGSGWDCSSLSVSGQCENQGGVAVAVFTIRNTGEPGGGDMEGPTNYYVEINDQSSGGGQVGPLQGGASTTITISGNSGDKVRLIVDQRPGHPGNSRPQADVTLDCGPAPTDVPPTPVPPTQVPPTDVPPTDVPPTDVPPTDVPPTDVPPTDVPPTDVPPTEVPPTDVPPTDVPPTDVPPTDVPPTEVPPTDVPPTDVPPTDETPVPTDTPTDEPDEPTEPVCGQIGVDEKGFPIIDATIPCGDDDIPVDWTPIEPGQAVCPDWLLYHTNQTGDYEIFRLGELADNPDADPNVSQGIGEGVFDLAPSRSADAEWVVFSTNRDGNFEVYVTRPDGTDQQRITIDEIANAPIDTDPVWSPNGQYIAYESLRGATWDLYLFDVTSGEEVRLTQSGSHDINPYWHPESNLIIFQSFRDGFWQLYTIDIETFEETLVSDGAGDDHDPQYNSDGTQLIFRSFRDGDNSVIYLLDIETGELIQISNPEGYASNQVWSDDDQLIAYQSDLADENGNTDTDVYSYEVETGEERLITDNDIPDYAPTWYCNSHIVVWTSDFVAQDDPNLFSTDADVNLPSLVDLVAEATQLTDDPNVDQYPQNSPSEENASRQDQVPGSLKNR